MTVLRLLVRLIAFLLIFESFFAALYMADILPQLGIYDAVAIALILAGACWPRRSSWPVG